MTGDDKQPNSFLKVHRKSVQMTTGNAVGLGSSFALAMGLLAFGGYKLDDKLGSSPLFLLVGLFLGLTYGFWEVLKVAKMSAIRQQRTQEEASKGASDLHGDAES